MMRAHHRAGVWPARFLSLIAVIVGTSALNIFGGAPPLISYEPIDQSVDRGAIVQFYASANDTNDGVPHYQWYHGDHGDDDMPLAGRSGFSPSAYLYLTNISSSDVGGYYVVITNGFGAVTSQVARLSVLLRAPVVTVHP